MVEQADKNKELYNDINTALQQEKEQKPISDEQKEAIIRNKLYYVPAGLGKGSINLVSGFENAKYLLLHHDKDRMFLELSDAGPKFFTAKTLQDMGFDPSGEYYLGFEIKSLNPVTIDGLDIGALDLRREGKYSFRPYFTTFKEIK